MQVARGRMPFVGRTPELSTLRESLAAAESGQGGVVLLAGEPGIGKTRLAEELTAVAEARGARVLWGRCYEGEGAPAFRPWVQILRTLLRDAEREGRRALSDGTASEIAALVPELQEGSANLSPTAAFESAPARFRLFESVTNALIADDARSTVLILDDLHWADVPSLLLLAFVAREIRASRLVIVGTYRDIEVGRQHPLVKTLAELARLPYLHRLHLRGLVESEVAALVAEMTGATVPPPVTSAMHTETEGNPFFLVELVRLLAGEGRLADPEALTVEGVRAGVPEGVREVIDRRLDRLSTECNRVLTAAAVMGREFRVNLLVPVAELGMEHVLDAIEEAETARIIAAAEAPGWYRFTHALIRETLYHALPATRRARLHLRTGEALRAFSSREPEPDLAGLAHHFLQALPVGDVETAMDYARRAGDHAMTVLAYEEAAEHYESALRAIDMTTARDEWRRCELQRAIGEAWMRAGNTTLAQVAFSAAASIARFVRTGGSREGGRAAEMLARAALGYGSAGVQTGLVDERLIELLEEALAALGDKQSPLRVRLLGRLAMELYWSDARDRRIELSHEAVELARRTDDASALAFALSARHLALWEPENVEERLQIGAELLQAAQSTGDREMMLQGHARRIPDLLEVGEVRAAEQEIESHGRLANELRQPHYQWEALRFRALTAYLHGRFEEMERAAAEALTLAERAQIGGADVLFVSQIQFLRREQGRLEEMEAPFNEIRRRYPRLATSWRIALANLYAQAGRAVEAKRELDEMALSEFAAAGRSLPSIGIIALLTEAIVHAGDARAAATVYGQLRPYAGRYIVNAATPNFYGAAPHYLGMLAATMSRWDDAIAHFESALAMNTRTGVPPHLVYTQVEYAKSLLHAERATRDADIRKAYELLDAALRPARELGMSRICAQIEHLQRSRRPAQRGTPAAPDAGPAIGLTPRESEVLGLLASGLSNQEIADRLVVTVNTVERHLVSVYGKLGVKGRSAATAYAHRHGLA